MRQRPKIIAQRPWRMLAISLVLALLFGLAGMGEPLEDVLRVARNKASPVAASGDIVVVAIDDDSQKLIGAWPWPRQVHGDMIQRLTDAGARKIVMDIGFDYRTDRATDREFAAVLKRSGRVVLPSNLRVGEGDGTLRNRRPDPIIADQVELGLISFPYNFRGAVWRIPFALEAEGQRYRSYASIMSGRNGAPGTFFPINYRIDLDTVPQFSAADVARNRIGDKVRGKTVIIGATSDNIGDNFAIPGRSRRGGVFVHVLGAETLKRSLPVTLGWMPMLLVALGFVLVATQFARARGQGVTLALALIVTLAVPQVSESVQWFVDVTPALFLLTCVGIALLRRRYRARGTVNPTSGLPNLTALRTTPHQRDRALIVARIINYPHLAAAVSGDGERALVDQIVQRLTVGAQDHVIFQGDEGIFAWFTEPGTAIGHHVEALHALFRSPAKIDGATYDLNVTFGVEIGSGRALAQRLNSALVAADEAASEGLKWKYHDPERMKDANWRLSLLSQLDTAIENGEVWVAFQPQLDLRTGRIRGAEALARWTHPEKGPISPQEFVSAAEQGGRIEKLTMFVLEQAVAAAARFNRESPPFDMAVNLSARMLTMRSLSMEVRAVLARHGLDPARLTLELTETAALAGDGSDLAPLLKLRDLGVRLSIDDYGTGLSTLDYLKKVPASEIKIDQSFIKAMRDHRSDLVMVQSTIALAHSLDRTVVAEGVESEESLDMLRTLGCDSAQGFLIGRPTSAKGLLRRLQDERRKRAA
jgi:EAL domain-containing protein (putative c-di-GMP-specific phosphodiesterase class I)/CHASE2 domain-containing sensor protein